VFGRGHISYASTLQNRAAIAEARGQYRAADSLIAGAMEVSRQHSGRATGVYVEGLLARARLQARLGEYSRAEALLREALELAPSQYLPGSRRVRSIHMQLADLYQQWHRPADAARHRRLAQP
jgi:tetratricopeptide (TPR) repeat protein